MRHAAAAALCAAAVLAGCSTPALQPAPASAEVMRLGRTVVVPSTQEPELAFGGFARSRGEGAVQGAGVTLLSCVGALVPATCAGPLCGAMAAFWLGVCGVSSAVGGVVGAASAMPAEDSAAATGRLHRALQAQTVQASLCSAVHAAASTRGSGSPAIESACLSEPPNDAAAVGADHRLEVALTYAGTRGGGFNGPLQLQMRAQARLLRASDAVELASARAQVDGPRKPLTEWAQDEGRPLVDALAFGVDALAEQLLDNLLLLYPFPAHSPQGAGLLSLAFGLAPIEPPTRGTLSDAPLIGPRFEWTEVSDLQPTLRWQAFPRQIDRDAAAAAMQRVQSVRYDLRIAREQAHAAAAVVYRRDALADPWHRLEVPLDPDARYFWSVRARFILDGRERVTEWAMTASSGSEPVAALSRWSYRFRTPSR